MSHTIPCKGSPLLSSGVQITVALTLPPATALSNAVSAIPDLNAAQEYDTLTAVIVTTAN